MPEPTTTWRLFLAVPLDEASRRALAHTVTAAALPGRAVPPSNWHITLRFLGDLDPPTRQSVHAAMSAAGSAAGSAFDLGPPFTLRLTGIAAFPTAARARVLVARVEDPTDVAHDDDVDGRGRLAAIAAHAEVAATSAGLPPERRPFTPHVTLARLRKGEDMRDRLDRALAHVTFDIALPVTKVVLYRSHLGAGPPRYEVIAEYRLWGDDWT